MICTKKVSENLYEVRDDTYFLQYRKDSEYVNATALCKMIRGKLDNALGRWLRYHTTAILLHDLGWHLADAQDTRPYYNDKVTRDIFIHPTMVFNLVVCLDAKFNFPICMLMKQITCNGAIETSNVRQYFTVFQVHNSKMGPLKRFYAFEGTIEETNQEYRRIVNLDGHQESRRFYQECKANDQVSIREMLREDFRNNGNVCIDNDGYCGTTMDNDQFFDFLKKLCLASANVNTYDEIDYSNSNCV
jgi:hypothetical protein